jgi:hypothetical protein
MLKPIRPSDGFMPADEDQRLSPRSSTPMLGCNAHCWTAIEGEDEGLILTMVPTRSCKAHLQKRVGRWNGLVPEDVPCFVARVGARKIAGNQQFNFNCLRILSRTSSASISK